MNVPRSSSLRLEEMTLREKLREAERLSRDFEEHLKQGFSPKVHELRKLCKPQESDLGGIPDISIRHQIQQVLASERYSSELYATLEHGLVLIAEDLHTLLESDQSA
ncbi:hypothetical protein Spb1_40910 [Planctopirus ephydatiae]|uniref:Uncharacterized protein n=1 Tax=Planctopirus ephydatiae TaxID=2528019 RepID=A0A518GU70_9PLAN|nr:hypothetical protein [Planctopirus ephydatiae]QDV32142.1 hypothetical protein Spb1_40910 [Planctopirus ephydatiae]